MPTQSFVEHASVLDSFAQDSAARPRVADTAAAYREHADLVWSCLGRLGLRAHDREDALQEVFLVVHRRWSAFEARSSLRTWIYGIAVHVALAQLRRARLAGVRTTGFSDLGVELPDPAEDPQCIVEQREAAVHLDALLAELDTDKRVVLVLADVEGLSVPTIAELLALNLRTTYSRLRVARADFERAMARWHARRTHVEQPPAALVELRRATRERAPARAWSAIAAAIVERGAAAPLSAGLAGIGGVGIAKLITGVGTIVGVIVVATHVGTASPRSDRDATPGPSVAPASVEVAAELGERELPRAEPVAQPSMRLPDVTPSVRAAPPRVASATTASDESVEIELLRRARAALRAGAATDALTILTEQQRVAGQRYADERTLLRIEASCRLGRTLEARTHAESWVRAHPGSTAADVLAQRCAPP